MTPRSHAIAYRIWAYAGPLGWNCTIREVADAIGVSFGSVKNIAVSKGWAQNFRANSEAATSRAIFLDTHTVGGLPRDMITPADYHARAELGE
jgi:hypothetical protein